MTNPTERPEERVNTGGHYLRRTNNPRTGMDVGVAGTIGEARERQKQEEERDSLARIEKELAEPVPLYADDGELVEGAVVVGEADLRTLINEVKERDHRIAQWRGVVAIHESQIKQMEEALREGLALLELADKLGLGSELNWSEGVREFFPRARKALG